MEITNIQGTSKKAIKPINKLHLSNIVGIKKSLSRIANLMLQDPEKSGNYRNVAYCINILATVHKIDQDSRIAEIEKRLDKAEGKI